jgi:hypothetical protein
LSLPSPLFPLLARAFALAATVFVATALPAQVSTRVASDAPIVNFRLPTFTAEGYREWLVRGTEARMHSAKEIDIRELTLTVFTGDATDKITTMILAPMAKVLPEERTVTGQETIRVLNDSLEATGTEWRVHQPGDKAVDISLRKNVRVTFRAELKNLLQ